MKPVLKVLQMIGLKLNKNERLSPVVTSDFRTIIFLFNEKQFVIDWRLTYMVVCLFTELSVSVTLK